MKKSIQKIDAEICNIQMQLIEIESEIEEEEAEISSLQRNKEEQGRRKFFGDAMSWDAVGICIGASARREIASIEDRQSKFGSDISTLESEKEMLEKQLTDLIDERNEYNAIPKTPKQNRQQSIQKDRFF